MPPQMKQCCMEPWKAKEEGHFGSITSTGSLPGWIHRGHTITSGLIQGKAVWDRFWGCWQHQEEKLCLTILFGILCSSLGMTEAGPYSLALAWAAFSAGREGWELGILATLGGQEWWGPDKGVSPPFREPGIMTPCVEERPWRLFKTPSPVRAHIHCEVQKSSLDGLQGRFWLAGSLGCTTFHGLRDTLDHPGVSLDGPTPPSGN